METKGIVFKNILPLLNTEGIVFGTTFLFHGVKRNLLATNTFWWANKLRFMSNQQDSLEGLTQGLKKYFTESHIDLCGCEALFWARK
jgi:hypothetical protein